ncbi:hypothetical protein LJC56_08355, partial [Christensenellaceae bacterium OttesenSCG-928-K19]|nr:hypothetical protein [Christensenellaceae bacterium OttesenSCG-928-K19]
MEFNLYGHTFQIHDAIINYRELEWFKDLLEPECYEYWQLYKKHKHIENVIDCYSDDVMTTLSPVVDFLCEMMEESGVLITRGKLMYYYGYSNAHVAYANQVVARYNELVEKKNEAARTHNNAMSHSSGSYLVDSFRSGYHESNYHSVKPEGIYKDDETYSTLLDGIIARLGFLVEGFAMAVNDYLGEPFFAVRLDTDKHDQYLQGFLELPLEEQIDRESAPILLKA